MGDSELGSTIGGIVGQLVGGELAGPAGAAVAGAIGSAIGGDPSAFASDVATTLEDAATAVAIPFRTLPTSLVPFLTLMSQGPGLLMRMRTTLEPLTPLPLTPKRTLVRVKKGAADEGE
jgi:hypothetical protein